MMFSRPDLIRCLCSKLLIQDILMNRQIMVFSPTPEFLAALVLLECHKDAMIPEKMRQNCFSNSFHRLERQTHFSVSSVFCLLASD
jgi:hypothetical protein